MAEPVSWLADGTPHSPRFQDVYRSAGSDGQGGWEQARQVFLAGCGLLDATTAPWAHQPSWHVLENGWGLGLNFLATWHAWRASPCRPTRLHYSAIEAWPVSADDVRRSVQHFPALQDLAEELAAQWWGLLPGTHRIELDAGQVVLQVHIGSAPDLLPTLDAPVDSVFLDGFAPRTNPDMWSAATLQGVARLCRPGTRLATWTVARTVRDALSHAGFDVEKVAGLPPKRHRLQAVYAPRWNSTVQLRAPWVLPTTRRRAVVVGAGLAGSAVAYSLAQRGWEVQVLDAAEAPAAGASALAAGLVAAHVSPDDAPLSRLSRAGLRLTRQRAQTLLELGRDWAPTGVLEHRVQAGRRHLPQTEAWARWGAHWSQVAQADQLAACGLEQCEALWHPHAFWLRPAQLVRAQLHHPRIHWHGLHPVHALQRHANGWTVLGPAQQALAQAEWVVLASAWHTRALWQTTGAPPLPLNPLRGQVTWGRLEALDPAARASLPPWPVNGHGALIHGVPGPDGSPAWMVGSTFERAMPQALIRPEDRRANLDKLHGLLPRTATHLAAYFDNAQDWAAVRCTLPDRLPAVGMPDPKHLPGLAVCTGLGARGLTLSVLCGEWLGAALHGEPWPLDRALAQALSAQRLMKLQPTS